MKIDNALSLLFFFFLFFFQNITCSIYILLESYVGLEVVPVTVSSVGTSVFDGVTARRSKTHGEFVSLKQRPMTSRAVCYRIELAMAKPFMPG